MKHVRVSLEDVEQATKRLDATKKHIESCAQRVIKNDLENTRYENERRKSMKEFKAREKTLKAMKNNLHRQTMEPKQMPFVFATTNTPNSPAPRSGEIWTPFEDDNLKDAFELLLRSKAEQYGRSPHAIRCRIRDKAFFEVEANDAASLRRRIAKKVDEAKATEKYCLAVVRLFD